MGNISLYLLLNGSAKLNRILFFVGMLCFCAISYAGILFQFDEKSLIGLRSNEIVHGYFYEQTGTGLFQCGFFFQGKTTKAQSENSEKIPIKLFRTASTYDKRVRDSDDDGYLYVMDGNWVIQSKMANADCHSVNAGLFSASDSNGWPFSVAKKEQAYGILTLKRKSNIFTREKNGKTKRQLSAGEIVILLSEHGEMAHIKYKISDSENEFSSGWVTRSNLVNPFLNGD